MVKITKYENWMFEFSNDIEEKYWTLKNCLDYIRSEKEKHPYYQYKVVKVTYEDVIENFEAEQLQRVIII